MFQSDRIVVLDGGLSTALELAGADVSGDLWTARLLRDDPAAIVAAHAAYVAAGAEVAITASYQASVPGFVEAGMERDDAERLIRSSVSLARAAGSPLVAASVGPYGAVLADGSEYRGDYGLSPTELRDFHLSRLDVLASAEPDLFAVETIPDAREAEVLVPLLDEVGIPAWFSYTVADGRTRAGQPLDDAFAVLAGSTAIVAAGVNCSAPDDVLAAIRAAVNATGLSAVAYPNRGEHWDADTDTWRGADSFSLDLVPGWIDAGARLVGGCCQIAPSDIAALAGVIRSLAT